MPTIDASRPLLTLVNVFTVPPARQAELVELLERATEETMRHLDGFISASIHRSSDGKRVINYAQWRDRAAFETALQSPQAAPHIKACVAIADFDPIICEVVSTH